MEDAIPSTHGSAAFLEGIPGEAEAWFKIVVLIVVERVAGARSDDGKSKRSRPARIGKKIREVVVYFEGDTKVLIAQTVCGGEIWQQFPGVLGETGPLALTEAAQICRTALLILVEILSLRLVIHISEEGQHGIFRRRIHHERRTGR